MKTDPSPTSPPQGPPPALGWLVGEGIFSKSFENIALFSNEFDNKQSEFFKIVNFQLTKKQHFLRDASP